jgi:hypothetical protein
MQIAGKMGLTCLGSKIFLARSPRVFYETTRKTQDATRNTQHAVASIVSLGPRTLFDNSVLEAAIENNGTGYELAITVERTDHSPTEQLVPIKLSRASGQAIEGLPTSLTLRIAPGSTQVKGVVPLPADVFDPDRVVDATALGIHRVDAKVETDVVELVEPTTGPTTQTSTGPTPTIPGPAYTGDARTDSELEKNYIISLAPGLNTVWFAFGDAGTCDGESRQTLANLMEQLRLATGQNKFRHWNVDVINGARGSLFFEGIFGSHIGTRYHTVVVIWPKPTNVSGNPFTIDHWQSFTTTSLGDWLSYWDASKGDTISTWQRIIAELGL